jgi:peroxiredoxin-like protein
MQPFPHVYSVDASGTAEGVLTLSADALPDLMSAAPREFDGPGDQWSPESLLSAALASCFILTFRAIARGSKLEWSRLECTVEGTVERIEGVTQFTRILTRARLTVPAAANTDLCTRVLEKSEHGCLVANSLRSRRELQTEIVRV